MIQKRGKGERIMVVDDEPSIVDVIYRFLTLEDFHVIKALSGKECLDKIKSERPDLILLDLSMPDMDGFQVMEKIKENKSIQQIPVIILTAKTSEIDQLKGWKKGAAHYITKPFDMNDLVDAVALALSERRRQNKEKTYEV